jgi:Cu(I)/Ag(I) efflux system membrane fusion protein
MLPTKKTLLGWFVLLAVIAALGGGAWYWHRTMTGPTTNDMNMPGMGSMPMGTPGTPSAVPGHAEVTLPSEVQQRIGVTVGKVEEARLRMSVRTVGIIKPDETKLAEVHLKTEGWVHKLFVDFTGQHVRKGDPLLSIYSPQFVTTQEEYLNARKADGGKSSLVAAARRRLELWDISGDEIEELEKTGKAQKYLTLRSPLTGTVLTKNATAGQYITAQTNLYVVADLTTVWVQAKVYEYELPHVELKQPASVTLPALPNRELTGKVVFVQPTVDEATRTTQVRIELPNQDGLLKPGMFAHVVIQHTMGTGLLVPTSAVIRTGERDIAYRVKSPGRFLPVQVKISPYTFGDRFHILDGLKAGDEVVTSANFLIDSESRLRAGGGGMPGMPGMEMGGMKDMGGAKSKNDMKGMDHSKMKH